MFKLLIEDEEGGKKVFPLVHDDVTIGRAEGNTIHLNERNISRHHGRLIREDGRLFVEAVSARYGLRKNGKRLSQREEFGEGDVLLIGDYRVTLQAEAKAKPVPAGLKAPPKAARSEGGFTDEVTKITSINETASEAAREHTQIMAAMPAKLIVISSNFAGQEFPLNRDEVVIGRGDDCHVIIDHRSISTKHAKVVRESNTVYKIVDLNSKNGVKVSGEEYRATHLKRGDIVELGHVKFRFVEPGENYVFTPQAAGFEDDFESTPQQTQNKKGLLMIIGAALMGVILLGAFILLQPSDTTPAGGSVATVAAGDSATVNRAQEAIDKAAVEIADGQLQRAMGALELVRTNLDPSPEQITQIGEMLSKARNEQPFQRSYTQAKELADNQKYSESLAKIQTIPSHSLFQELLEKQGLMQTVLNGAVAEAKENAQNGETQAARDTVAEILAYDSEHVEARKLLAQLDKTPNRGSELVAAVQPVEVSPRGQNLDPPKTVAKTAPVKVAAAKPATTRKKPPSVSPEEGAEYFKSAARKISTGDPRGAITDCQKGLNGGHIACHRILGLAYSQINDTSKACGHFSRFLRTQPSDRSNIMAQMEKLGCE